MLVWMASLFATTARPAGCDTSAPEPIGLGDVLFLAGEAVQFLLRGKKDVVTQGSTLSLPMSSAIARVDVPLATYLYVGQSISHAISRCGSRRPGLPPSRHRCS